MAFPRFVLLLGASHFPRLDEGLRVLFLQYCDAEVLLFKCELGNT